MQNRRRLRTRFIFGLVAGIVASATVAGLVIWGRTNDPAVPPPARAAQKDVTCDSQKTREPCSQIEVAGRLWRYAFLPAETKTAETVLLDFGGPGLSALSGSAGISVFRSTYPRLAQRYNVLAIEEPWVTEPVPDECGKTQTAYYLAFRNGTGAGTDEGLAVARTCGLSDHRQRWGFDAESYRSVVAAINREHGTRLSGFIGHSWGSVRLAYLGGDAVVWSILLRPFPVGVGADRLIEARTNAINGAIGAVTPIAPGQVRDRSLEVTAFDQLSAVVDLGYVSSQSYDSTAEAVYSGARKEQIGKLSDALWGRYGTDFLSPGNLAQFQEVCSVVGASSRRVSTITSPSDVLLARHAPCGEMRRQELSATTASKACVVTSKRDSVAPDALVREVYGKTADGVRFVVSEERSHSSFDGIEACLSMPGVL
nr:hypothetical protein [Kibdelosporangium sp. MJ126-NF4]